ncbi:hypothetical protein MLD38_025895 [Melastoma candidum]|uniref:Uncharacterized protein n=1 Tax=Melastoma candidum TaxID=119954 RepID=A0ACB9NYF2_9MYRT|nr:hypothetical protein MLD38_025895 [Melastoma candidum]
MGKEQQIVFGAPDVKGRRSRQWADMLLLVDHELFVGFPSRRIDILVSSKPRAHKGPIPSSRSILPKILHSFIPWGRFDDSSYTGIRADVWSFVSKRRMEMVNGDNIITPQRVSNMTGCCYDMELEVPKSSYYVLPNIVLRSTSSMVLYSPLA